jgi:hypothetical protein
MKMGAQFLDEYGAVGSLLDSHCDFGTTRSFAELDFTDGLLAAAGGLSQLAFRSADRNRPVQE